MEIIAFVVSLFFWIIGVITVIRFARKQINKIYDRAEAAMLKQAKIEYDLNMLKWEMEMQQHSQMKWTATQLDEV